MRVSSDACLLGAYVPVEGARTILDMGTGTGVLALMVAQRADPSARIDAVELCAEAARMARQNVAESPFAHAIEVHEMDIALFSPPDEQKYDLIVVNPPFYAEGTRRRNPASNLARHAGKEGLDFTGLIRAADRLLHPTGILWILLPATRHMDFLGQAAARNFYEKRRLAACHRPDDKINRVICAFSRGEGPPLLDLLVRHDTAGGPSPRLRALLQNYMLHYS